MAVSRSQKIAPFKTITQYATLVDAFARVAKAGGGAGGDGVSLHQFACDTRKELKGLVVDLSTGRYQPRPIRRYNIAKPDGGKRGLAVPSIRDRIVQSAVARLLSDALDGQMSEASFAYRKGLSVEHAGALVMFYQLRGFGWAVDGDIKKYFDNVPHAGVEKMLRRFQVCPDTIKLISLWLKHYSGKLPRERTACGLAQGSPLSPVLANLFLTPFDKKIETKRVRLVRYADDFLLLTRRKSEAIKAEKNARAVLSELGLHLNLNKTSIVKFSDGVRFLGLRFDGRTIGKV